MNKQSPFRKMRRHRQQLSESESIEILRNCTSGVLALAEPDGYPYAVPLSYVYTDGKIYFHSALAGHKIELLQKNPKVSFCVIQQDEIRPAEFTTYFRSVIVFGTARIITDEKEKLDALRRLGMKYSTDDEAALSAEIQRGFSRLLMIEISIDHITGKEAIELMRAKTLPTCK